MRYILVFIIFNFLFHDINAQWTVVDESETHRISRIASVSSDQDDEVQVGLVYHGVNDWQWIIIGVEDGSKIEISFDGQLLDSKSIDSVSTSNYQKIIDLKYSDDFLQKVYTANQLEIVASKDDQTRSLSFQLPGSRGAIEETTGVDSYAFLETVKKLKIPKDIPKPSPPSVPLPQEPVIDEIFKIVEIMPLFGGCTEQRPFQTNCNDQELDKYVQSKINYPYFARKKKIEGTVFVRFVIEKEGTITEPKVVRGLGEGCDKEALRIVNTMNDLPPELGWVPGFHRGRKVKVLYTVAVIFKLRG